MSIFYRKTVEIVKVYMKEIGKRLMWTINMQKKEKKKNPCTRTVNEEKCYWKDCVLWEAFKHYIKSK